MTNVGLITAKEVQLDLPDDIEYELITTYQPQDILAQQAIQVPVVMRRRFGGIGLRTVNEVVQEANKRLGIGVNKNVSFHTNPEILLNTTNQSFRVCGSNQTHKENMKSSKFVQYRRILEQKLAEGTRSNNCTNIITIPVAFHFSGNVNNNNMSCILSTIQDQLESVNRDFAGLNFDKDFYLQLSNLCSILYPEEALFSSTCIQFYLAAPNGNAAVTFNENVVQNSGEGQYSFDAPGWEGYLNIFVSDIIPLGKNPGLAGFVSDIGEGSNPDGTTGIFIVSKYFGANENSCSSGVTFNSSTQFRLGRTLTHELGHFFGLYHIFQSIDCNIDEDLIEDTPIQTEPNFGIKSVNENCSSNANNTCVSNEFFFNYMDYGDDSALIMFTVDQATIIYQTALLGNYVHPINNEPILGNQCFDIVYIDYNYQCGPTILYETTARQFRYGGRVCSAPPTVVTNNPISNNGDNGNNDGPGGPGGPGNGNNVTVTSGVNIPPVTTKNEDCRECLDLLLKKLNKAILNNQNGGN